MILTTREMTIAIWEQYQRKSKREIVELDSLSKHEREFVEFLSECALAWMKFEIPQVFSDALGKEFIFGKDSRRIRKLSEAFKEILT